MGARYHFNGARACRDLRVLSGAEFKTFGTRENGSKTAGFERWSPHRRAGKDPKLSRNEITRRVEAAPFVNIVQLVADDVREAAGVAWING